MNDTPGFDNRGRNLRAEAHADQIEAAIRDGGPFPDGPTTAAAARTIRKDELPEEIRDVAGELLEQWAEDEGVDRPAE